MKPIGRLNILVFSKMATERVLGGVALRRAKSAVGAEVVKEGKGANPFPRPRWEVIPCYNLTLTKPVPPRLTNFLLATT